MSPEAYLAAYLLGALTGLALAVACEWLVAWVRGRVRCWWADRLLRKGFKAARRMGYLPRDAK